MMGGNISINLSVTQDLCIQLTGSADLCDAEDATSAADATNNSNINVTGIIVRAGGINSSGDINSSTGFWDGSNRVNISIDLSTYNFSINLDDYNQSISLDDYYDTEAELTAVLDDNYVLITNTSLIQIGNLSWAIRAVNDSGFNYSIDLGDYLLTADTTNWDTSFADDFTWDNNMSALMDNATIPRMNVTSTLINATIVLYNDSCAGFKFNNSINAGGLFSCMA